MHVNVVNPQDLNKIQLISFLKKNLNKKYAEKENIYIMREMNYLKVLGGLN